MHLATSSPDAPLLDSRLPAEAVPFTLRAAERRHGVEYLESRGLDYPLVLFWGAYLTGFLVVIIELVRP